MKPIRVIFGFVLVILLFTFSSISVFAVDRIKRADIIFIDEENPASILPHRISLLDTLYCTFLGNTTFMAQENNSLAVRLLQYSMYELGIRLRLPDGRFNEDTQHELSILQAAVIVPRTGIFDTNTSKRFKEAYCK